MHFIMNFHMILYFPNEIRLYAAGRGCEVVPNSSKVFNTEI